ncbi:hypothetical protein CEXT_394261 [Caerostris extrusa]|uniref:Uncharacterized protein n=1 Tax=Caerostris extrusa TaxID=172846 RepID=A0AAV4XKN9_CAEEX|nr:hypothetical protein CEXT_394261 [Caerostris extrusa]
MLKVPIQELLMAAMFVMEVIEERSAVMLVLRGVLASCCCCFRDAGWQGLPSLTRTGTATLLGEGRGFTSSPFSWRARFVLDRILRKVSEVPVILEPDFDLCGRETDDAGQVLSLGGRKIPLLPEPIDTTALLKYFLEMKWN